MWQNAWRLNFSREESLLQKNWRLGNWRRAGPRNERLTFRCRVCPSAGSSELSACAFLQPFWRAAPRSVTRWINYFFNIWSFRRLKICPMAWNICHGRFQMFPSTKLTPKMLPKTCAILPKGWNFAKSGHTVRNRKYFMHTTHDEMRMIKRIYCCRSK